MESSEKPILANGSDLPQTATAPVLQSRTLTVQQSHNAAVGQSRLATLQRRTVPLRVRIGWVIEDFLDDKIMKLTWQHILYKLLAYLLLSANLYLFCILANPKNWGFGNQSDKVPIKYQNFKNYFTAYEGFAQCDIKANDLYVPPLKVNNGAICSTRRELLESMSNGGRIGFDAPYTPVGCHYRWYTTEEICMVLDRFDGIVFIGDDSLQRVYNGLNILLRQDLATGALKSWEMNHDLLDACRCDSQFTTSSCAQHYVTSSDEVTSNTPSIGSAYACSRFPHSILRIDGSPAHSTTHEQFKKLVPRADRSNYHSIPIIHALSPSTASASSASQSLSEFLQLADASKRKTPMLWIGPTAAGHIDTKNRKGNQEIWDFDSEVASVARDNDIEVLKMWNMTAQATSFDGVAFGEKVAITQAMMVVNWLGRLESS